MVSTSRVSIQTGCLFLESKLHFAKACSVLR